MTPSSSTKATLADRYEAGIGRRADAVFRRAYADFDKLAGRLMQALAARGDTALIIASDHGGGVNNAVCDVNQRLRDLRLLAGTDREIDWRSTQAYTKRTGQGTEIYVDLKGREPHGIVEPRDYEKVQEAVIDALLDWRSPIHGKRAITYALKLRDAALIGYWGGRRLATCSSATTPVLFGARIPAARPSPLGQLLAWGPGIAKGVKREETSDARILQFGLKLVSKWKELCIDEISSDKPYGEPRP